MKKAIIDFAKRYESENIRNPVTNKSNIKTSYPAVFVVLGDSELSYVNQERFYMQIKLPYWVNQLDKKTARADLFERFYSDAEMIISLNKQIRALKTQIQKTDDLLLDKVNVYIISEAHRYESAVLGDVSLLVKSILQEDFSVVCMELFCLLQENNDVEDFALKQAFMMSLFTELDEMQNENFNFNKPLKMVEQEIAMPVTNYGRIFENVFLLSDRNFNGTISSNSDEKKSKIILSISQLKNIYSAYYNEQQYAQIINSLSESSPCYSTVGYNEIVKPDYVIAITVLYCIFERYYDRIESNKVQSLEKEDKEIFDFESNLSLTETIEDDLLAVLSNKSVGKLELLTLKEAEEAIYGDSLMNFFKLNFTDKMEPVFLEIQKNIEALATEKIREALYIDETLKIVTAKINVLSERVQNLKNQIDDRYAQKTSRFFQTTNAVARMFFKDAKMERTKKEIVAIYILKLELETLQRKLECYKNLQQQLLQNVKLQSEAAKLLEEAKKEANELFVAALNESEQNRFGKNIKEYYKKCVDDILNAMENNLSQYFYFKDEYIGNVNVLLSKDGEIMKRVIRFAESYVFSNPMFHKSFETELADRSGTSYEGYTKDGVDRTDFYKYLFETLDVQSVLNINLITTADNLYHERYYIGSKENKFMKYVKTNKSFKMKIGFADLEGCESSKQINISGGFRLSDLKIYAGCLSHYQAYLNNGYRFNKKEEEVDTIDKG